MLRRFPIPRMLSPDLTAATTFSLCALSIVPISFAQALILRIISSFWIWVTRIRLQPKKRFEDLFNELSENLWLGLVDVMVVVDKKNFRVKFKSGMEVSVEL